ncbi:hypothetical protein JCM10550A_12070 [Methanogenium cariaci]
MLCNYVSKEFSFSTNSGFEDEIVNYPATIACYLVLKGIFNYSEGKYWNYVRDDIKEFNAAKGQMLGKAFLRFIEKNGLFHVEIPRSQKYVTPILMHGTIPQEQVQEYFENIIYPLVTRELVCPTDTVEISDWLTENRKIQKDEERFQELSKEIETLLNEFPDGEYVDPDTVLEEIDALNRQITLLSDELQTLDSSRDQFEKYQTIKRDIATAKNLETDLYLLEQKKENVSNRIRTISQSYEQNLFYSVFPEKVSDPDAFITYAENELINYLSSIAETGNSEEKERLNEFMQSFSDGITNSSIHLTDKAMEKYYMLLSVSMAHLPETDEYEITDISAAHVNGTSAFISQESSQRELPFNHSDTAQIYQDGAFHDIQSLYAIEDTPSDICIGTETEGNETPSSDTPVSSDELFEIHPPAEPDIQENPSQKQDIENICTGTKATDSVSDDIFPKDNVESTLNTSNTKPELGRIAESLHIQMQNVQKTKNEQIHSGLKQADNSHPLTVETIQKVRDELLETCCVQKDVQKNTEDTLYEYVCNDPGASTDPEIPSNTPEWNISLFEEETSSDTQAETPHNTEEATLKIDSKSDEFATKSEFDEISSENTDAREIHSVQEINRIELAGIGDEISEEILSDTYKSTSLAKDPVIQKPQRGAISLADDTKIPIKFRKKSFISRLIDALFRR